MDLLKSTKRTLIILIVLFFVIFGARAIYDFVVSDDIDIIDSHNTFYLSEKEGGSVKNYATLRMEYAAPVDADSAAVLDQKYERIATIASKTLNYDADHTLLDESMQRNKAIVQMEDSTGLEGGRRVSLVIGVRPENFDQMRDELLEIGHITSSTTRKVDKTQEYRQMLAEKETLEQRRASYVELKERGGSIDEMLKLEDKIIDVDTQIKQQLIGLGEYSDDNALCTINFTLTEGSEATSARKIWNAFVWTAGVYMSGLAALLFVVFVAFSLSAMWLAIKRRLEAVVVPEADISMGNEKLGE